MAIDHDALLAAIDLAKTNSYASDENTTLGQKRTKAIEYYLGLNTNPAPEGRSQVVDRSVYETIQVMLPSLVRIFAGSSEEVCKAVPIGPDDEEGAEQTTAVLRHYVTEKNNWEQTVSDWLHDAALLSNGYCMAYWDESKRLIRERYDGQSDEQLTALTQDPNVKVIEHSQNLDKEATQKAQEQFQAQMAQYQQMAGMAQQQQTGQPPQLPPPPQEPQPVYLHDLLIERTENEGKVCIKTLAPEHCNIALDTPDWTLDECPYFEYKQQKTISDLRSMGLDVPEDISDDENINSNSEDFARSRFGESYDNDNNEGVMRRVWARMIWVRADAEGDDESRLYYVIAVGKTILFAEPCGRIPVASGTLQPLPHRHIGMSLAETVMDIQDVKQAVKRGGLDNLYLANNGRHVVSSKVNIDDMLDSRPGGLVRMLDDSPPGEGHIFPLVHPFAFDQIIGSLEYFDQERQNRSGASRYFSGTDAGAINKTMGGTIALQNMASMRVEHYARMFAPAVESLFNCVWEIISKHANKPLAIKLSGKWTLVDPQAWRTKRDIRISVGVGAGNKESMMGQLMQIFGAQMQTMPLGIAGPPQVHETVLEMAKLAGFSNPDKFWIDPTQNPPPPPPPNPDIVKIQADMQKHQTTMQADIQKTQAQIELEKQKLLATAIENDKNRELEAEKARMSEATKLAIAEMNRSTTLETTQASQSFEAQKMGATFDREDMKSRQEQEKVQEKDDGMAELLGNLQNAIGALAQSMSMEKELVVDPKTGRKRVRMVPPLQ